MSRPTRIDEEGMVETGTKVCSKCGVEWGLDGFHRGAKWCKICKNEQRRKYYQVNRNRISKYRSELRRNNLNEIREKERKYRHSIRSKLCERDRKYYQTNKEKIRDYIKRYRQANRKKCDATSKLCRAIKQGLLQRSKICEMADDSCLGQIEAHHDDYDKPLEVRWLCKSHHRRLHAEVE
jgi:hypothetical protein